MHPENNSWQYCNYINYINGGCHNILNQIRPKRRPCLLLFVVSARLKYARACKTCPHFSLEFLPPFEKETLILISLCFTTFIIVFPNYHLQIKRTKTYQNLFNVLFLGRYTPCCITGNPIASLHSLHILLTLLFYIVYCQILCLCTKMHFKKKLIVCAYFSCK